MAHLFQKNVFKKVMIHIEKLGWKSVLIFSVKCQYLRPYTTKINHFFSVVLSNLYLCSVKNSKGSLMRRRKNCVRKKWSIFTFTYLGLHNTYVFNFLILVINMSKPSLPIRPRIFCHTRETRYWKKVLDRKKYFGLRFLSIVSNII